MSQKEENVIQTFGTGTGQTFKALILFCFLAFVTEGCGKNNEVSQPQAPINASTFLTRSQQNPFFTNLSSSGTGSVTVDSATRRISGVIVTNGIVGTQAHIHSGTPGVAGPVEIALTGGPTVWTIPDGTVLTLDQLAKLNAGQLYYNVHSAKFPGGELRGQLNQQVRSASLSGANEAPTPNNSIAAGTGVLALDPLTRRVSGFVRTTGITFIDPASPGHPAPLAMLLSPFRKHPPAAASGWFRSMRF